MLACVGEPIVIRVGRPIAPGQRVSFRGGSNGCFRVAFVALDLGENVQGIRVKQGIRTSGRCSGRSTDVLLIIAIF